MRLTEKVIKAATDALIIEAENNSSYRDCAIATVEAALKAMDTNPTDKPEENRK